MDELNGTMNEQELKMENNCDRSAEVVRWEKFLPRMALRVLLVEADHSTRQIITALLRKCSYTVIAVPDGLKAWETLKKKASELDLILTEVELPAISGFALLSLIMEHDICKNIPVIMMSSHDSVSMVLKCMLKGAVDFLIKPIRRNELRNLWQHVWRRHAISTPTQSTFPPKKLNTSSRDNTASNKSSGSVASSKKNDECSERLSEAQSTSTSPILDAESTCTENTQHAPHLNSSKSNKFDMVKYEEFTEFERESAKHNDETGNKSITIVPEAARCCDKTFELTNLRLEQDHGTAENENEDEILKSESGRDNPIFSTEIRGRSGEWVEPSKGIIDLIATFGNIPKHSNDHFSLNGGNTTKVDCGSQLELSLRSDFPGSSCKQASEATEESQRLNRSNTSAFSRYGNSILLEPLFPTPSVTSTKVNNPNWDFHESHKLSGITSGNFYQSGGSNQNLENMFGTVFGRYGQVGPKLSNGQCGLLPVSGVISDLSKGHDNVFTSVFYAQPDIHSMWNRKPFCPNESSPFPPSTSSQSNPESHNSDQHHDWSNDATCLNQIVKENNTDSDHARHDFPGADQTADNNLCHDAANHVNSSAYGSMESGNDGNATSAIVSKNNPETFSDSGCHNYDGFRVTGSHCSSQREAALTKFRLKRKERCFEKKVRYQSRKKLAEQRPRVKGQFVRQAHKDHPITEDGDDS